MSPWKGRNFGGGSSMFGPPIPGAIGGAWVTARGKASLSRCPAEDFVTEPTEALLVGAVADFVAGIGED
jgi:hypothetical protein